MNKILKLVLASLFLAALFINGGCGSSSTETKGKSTSLVTMTIGNGGKAVSLAIRPATLFARAELRLQQVWRGTLAIAAGIPTEVKSIVITVSAPDMTTINRSIQVLGQQEIIDSFEVPNGLGRLFMVGALDAGGKSIYSSEATRNLYGMPLDISFDMKPYTVKVTLIPGVNGVISSPTPDILVGGSTKLITITPDSGFRIVIPVGGTCPQGSLVGNTYTTGPITADCTVAPTFVIAANTVIPNAGANGSISPSISQTVISGSTKQFTITPNSGFNIVTPVGGTCPQGSLVGNTYTTGPITTDCTVTPSFSQIPLPTYTITPIAGANGNITPTTPQPVADGSMKQFVITPDNYYDIITPIGGTCPQGDLAGTTYTTGKITNNCTVEPAFTIRRLTVTPIIGVEASGTISPDIPQTVEAGTRAQFTFTLDSYSDVVTPIGGTCPQGRLVLHSDYIGDGIYNYYYTYITGVITYDCTVEPTFTYSYCPPGVACE